jgi:hypothetical protein
MIMISQIIIMIKFDAESDRRRTLAVFGTNPSVSLGARHHESGLAATRIAAQRPESGPRLITRHDDRLVTASHGSPTTTDGTVTASDSEARDHSSYSIGRRVTVWTKTWPS